MSSRGDIRKAVGTAVFILAALAAPGRAQSDLVNTPPNIPSIAYREGVLGTGNIDPLDLLSDVLGVAQGIPRTQRAEAYRALENQLARDDSLVPYEDMSLERRSMLNALLLGAVERLARWPPYETPVQREAAMWEYRADLAEFFNMPVFDMQDELAIEEEILGVTDALVEYAQQAYESGDRPGVLGAIREEAQEALRARADDDTSPCLKVPLPEAARAEVLEEMRLWFEALGRTGGGLTEAADGKARFITREETVGGETLRTEFAALPLYMYENASGTLALRGAFAQADTSKALGVLAGEFGRRYRKALEAAEEELETTAPERAAAAARRRAARAQGANVIFYAAVTLPVSSPQQEVQGPRGSSFAEKLLVAGAVALLSFMIAIAIRNRRAARTPGKGERRGIIY